MKERMSITKCDLVVAAVCLFFVLANARILTAGGRERSKLDVCMANLRVLTAVWNLYADENEDKIPGTYTSKCVCLSGVWPPMDCTTNPPTPLPQSWQPPSGSRVTHHSFPSWVEQPHQWDTTTEPSAGSKSSPHRYDLLPDGTANSWDFESHYLNKERDDQHAIACGTLWKYIRDYRVYHCPNGDKGIAVSYVGSDGLNGIHATGGWCNEIIDTQTPGWYPSIFIRSQIKRPAERIVFIDMGQRVGCSWNVLNTPTRMQNGCWSACPPVRHSKGTTFSFADGHVEYHRWTGRAIEVSKNEWCDSDCPAPGATIFNCDKDLFYMAKGICGSIGGTNDEAATIETIKNNGCQIEW